MSNGEDGTERSVSDVLAAIRARVQAEEAGLSAAPQSDGSPPMRLGAEQQVEDAESVRGLRRDVPVEQTPLRLDSPAEVPTLRLDAPVMPDPLRLDQPVEQTQDAASDSAHDIEEDEFEIDDVPEAPHIQIDDLDEEDAPATVTHLFAAEQTTVSEPSVEDDSMVEDALADTAALAEDATHVGEDSPEDQAVPLFESEDEEDAIWRTDAEDQTAPEQNADTQPDAPEIEAAPVLDELSDSFTQNEGAIPLEQNDILDDTEIEAEDAPETVSPSDDLGEGDDMLDAAGRFTAQEDDNLPEQAPEEESIEDEADQPSPVDGYDIWTAQPDVLVTGAAAAASIGAADVVATDQGTSSTPLSTSGGVDADAVRAIVQQVLSEQIASGDDDVRAEIRAIVAEEIRSTLGKQFAKDIRKSVQKDILRAFKDRGLN